jgi:hypothetical protein
VVKVLWYKWEGRWFDPRWCHWNFSLTYSFRSQYGSGVDSASNRNEYQEDFLEVNAGKCGRCVRLTNLPHSGAVVMKFGNLSFLETSGPFQACNRTDLPFFLFFIFNVKGGALRPYVHRFLAHNGLTMPHI